MTKSIGLLYNKTRSASKDSGDVVYLNSENINLDGYTNLKPYSVKASDEEIKIGFSVPNQQTMVYFSNETTKKNIDRTSFEKYNGSIYIAEPLTEKTATDILKKMEFFERYADGGNVNEGIPQPIIDMFDESYVFLKAKYPQYENLPLIQDTEEFWDMVEDVREHFETDTPTNYGEIGEELVRNYLYGHEKRFEEPQYAKGGEIKSSDSQKIVTILKKLRNAKANYLQAIKDSVRSISPIFHQYPNGSVAQQKISDLIRNLNGNLDYTVDKNWSLFENQIQNSIVKFSQGGMIDLFEDYKNIPTALQEVLDEYNEAFEDGDYSGLEEALTAVESMGYTFEYGLDGEAYGLRPKNTPLSELQGYEDSEEFATGGGVSSGIKVGDWVTLKSDKKRYKVKRVLSNNMIEITAGAKTLTVNISDVETNVKFFRSKFVPVPTNIEVKYKIGDRLKFNTKKGITEVGKVLLYKYVPTQNTIIYTIATDSGWKASVLQENLSKEYTSFTIPANNTPSPAPVKNTPPRTTFSIPSIEVGDKIEIIGSPNLTGTVTKVLSSTSEAEVLLSDSTGMTIKKGKSVPFTFSGSKIKKV